MATSAMFLNGFSSLRAGSRCRVLSVANEPHLLRFEELGLTPGTEFEVVKVAPFGDPIEIALRGYRLCLRKRDAAGIEIETI